MPTPAGVKDDGFALYDSGEERLRWSAPFPLPAIGTRVYITMNNIGWASIEGFFAEDGYVGVMTRLKNRRSGCANSVSAIRRTRGTRTSQIGGSKASAASLAPRSRWRSQLAIGQEGMTARFVPPFKSRRRSLESFGSEPSFARHADRYTLCPPTSQPPRCAATAASRFKEQKINEIRRIPLYCDRSCFACRAGVEFLTTIRGAVSKNEPRRRPIVPRLGTCHFADNSLPLWQLPEYSMSMAVLIPNRSPRSSGQRPSCRETRIGKALGLKSMETPSLMQAAQSGLSLERRTQVPRYHRVLSAGPRQISQHPRANLARRERLEPSTAESPNKLLRLAESLSQPSECSTAIPRHPNLLTSPVRGLGNARPIDFAQKRVPCSRSARSDWTARRWSFFLIPSLANH